jgi:HlyD family secretion protein
MAGALLAGCGKDKEKEGVGAEGHEAATPVTVETAVRGAIDHMVTADAVLYPINQANVTSKVTAPVKRMLVNRGDHVRAGQVLAELESSDLAAAANETKSQYEQAQAGYETTTGATLPEDKTKAQADLQAAQQTVESGEETV